MKNITINRQFGFVRFPFEITAQSDDLLAEWRKDAIVNGALAQQIGEINDYEVTAYTPQYPALNFDLFFHRRVNNVTGSTIRDVLSTAYVDYYDQMKEHFGNLNANADLEFNTGVPTSVVEYPTFWNSFGYPFYSRSDDWYQGTGSTRTLLPKRFDSKSYLYNSFLQMNFFTSPYTATQELLFQSVVYVNPRWNSLEGDYNGFWHRPTFNLNSATDGYYLYWLNQYSIDTFYVSFQFWDAANARMINFLPCGVNSTAKQWVQDTATGFDTRMLYLQYKMNYNTKKYSIGEFNPSDPNLRWNLYPNPIRLYEIIFDKTFTHLNPHIYVPNGVPTAVTTQTVESDVSVHLNVSDVVHFDSASASGTTVTYHPNSVDSFKNVRDRIKSSVTKLVDNYAKEVVVTNTGTSDVYLKRVEIILTDQAGSSRQARITSERKNVTDTTAGRVSAYMLASVPSPDMVFDGDNNGDGLQPYFIKYCKNTADRFNKPSPYYGWTTANVDEGKDAAGEEISDAVGVDWWASKANMGWYFPITTGNFNPWGYQFGEQLFVSHLGDDLHPIKPNEKLSVILNWTLGDKYRYAYLEPLVYELVSSPSTFSTTYHPSYLVQLVYTVNLYFNDYHSTLPEETNKKSFTVAVEYPFDYIGAMDDNNPNTNGGGGGHPL